jgi:putative transposase
MMLKSGGCAGELGYPKTMGLENGSDFISKELALWAFMEGVTLDFNRPSKLTGNAIIDFPNRKFRVEYLNPNCL